MAAFDNDPEACAIHRAIHPSIPMVRHDLHVDLDATIKIIKKIVPRKMRSLLHLHFSPPCQDLSSANKHANPDRGMANVIWCFELFQKLGAKYFTMENVPSMLDHIPDFVKRKFHCEVVDMSVIADLHQSRKRAIITNFKQRYTRSNSKLDMAVNSKINIPSHYQQLNNYGNIRSIFEPAFTVVGRQMHFYDTEAQQKVKMTAEQAWAIQGGTRSSFLRMQPVGLPTTKQFPHIGNMLPRPAAREIFESLCYQHGKSVGRQHRPLGSDAGTQQGLSCFLWEGKSFFSLQECMKATIDDSNGDSQTIRVRQQPYDYTNLGKVAGLFKTDKIKVRLADGTSIRPTLRGLVTLLRQRRVTKIRFRRLRLRAGDASHAARIVENIKRSPRRIHRHCADCTLNDLFIVYRTVTELTPKGKEFEYSKIKSAITRYCKGRYNTHPSPRFYFKIQTLHGIKRGVFKSFTRQLLQNIPIPGMVKQHILASSVFSFTKHKSIGDILCNHTKWGKNWSRSKPWQCHCRHLKQVLGTNETHRGHVHVRGSECRGEHRGVLASSLKDISIPAGDHLDHDLKWSISHYIRQITAYVSKLRRHRSFQRLMAKERIYSSAIPRSRREKFLMGLLLEEHIPVTPATLAKLGHIYNMKETEVTHSVPLASDVHNCVSALGKGQYAGALLDKNGSAVTITCPRLWWKFYKEEGWKSPDYTHTHKTHGQVLASYQLAYAQHGWKDIAPYHADGSIPYIYLFRKEKDMKLKCRKICSTVDHPLRLVSKYFALALYAVIKADHRTDSKFMNLLTTFDALPAFRRDYEDMHDPSDPDIRYLCYAGDIENMYNELDQGVIFASVAYVLWKSSRKRRGKSDWVSICKQDRHANRVGRAYAGGFLRITFQRIFAFVQYDILCSFFILGQHILLFKKGVPQGNTGSPLYAFCFCIYQEDMFFASIYDGRLLTNSNFTFGNNHSTPPASNKRYFDDCRLVVQYRKSDPLTKATARRYIDRYAAECYHPSVKIIPEPAGKRFKFLQGTFSFHPTFSCYYEGKNWEHWALTGKLKTRLIQHYFSYCESYKRQRFATLVGKFHEIRRFSYPESNVWRGILSIIPDLVFAQYPLTIIVGALRRMNWHRHAQKTTLAYHMATIHSRFDDTE
jgi:site-specific DNA-cytosine methylase